MYPEDDEELRAPPLITLSEDDLAFWCAQWEVRPDALEAAVRRYGPSVTAVARALGRQAEV